MSFADFIQRPFEIFSSSLEILGQNIPVGAKIDAMVSQAVRGLNSSRSSSPPQGSQRLVPQTTPAPKPAATKIQQVEGLILSGGGSYAAYEVGVIKALAHAKSSATNFLPWEPDVISGTSAGSLNAGLLLSVDISAGEAVKYLEQVWMQEIASGPGKCGSGVFRFRDNPLTFLNRSCYQNPVAPFSHLFADNVFLAQQFVDRLTKFLDSTVDLEQRSLEAVDLETLICIDPLKNLLQRTVCLDAIRRSPKKLRIAATNWERGDIRIFANADMTDEIGHDVIQASSAIPGIFPRVDIEDTPYVDGGVLMNTPLKPAIDAGAECLHVVFLDPEVASVPLPRLPNTVNDLVRSLLIGFSAELKRDLATAAIVNQEVLADIKASKRMAEGSGFVAASKASLHRQLTVHLHRPSQTLGPSWLSFDQGLIQGAINQGYDDTANHNCKLNKCLLPS